MPSKFRNSYLYLGIAIAVAVASFFKIADLDFWWHLKTGEIIFREKAFQHQEIYSFTAAGSEYIDHEWLFQVLQFLVHSAFGPAGIILFKILILISIYWISARFLLKNQLLGLLVAGILLLSICGARARFIERPEIFSTLFLLSTYMLLNNYLKSASTKSLLWILVITVIWSNTHAAVILGLLVQAVFLGGAILESLIQRSYPGYYNPSRRQIVTLAILLGASVLLTGVNPYGYRILLVPFELTAIIDSGILNNQEWQQPAFHILPFYYLCLIVTLLLNLIHFRKLHIINFALAAFFGFVSLKYVRNVGIFCMMMPVLIAPYLREIKFDPLPRISFAAGLLAFAVTLITNNVFEFGIGKASYFPDKIVSFTEQKDLRGHMINSYAFGGYFIWKLFPERKIFIDGRNEVYLPLLQKLHASVADSRKWKAILQDYQIEYALLNYVDDLEIVTVMGPGKSSQVTYAPFTSTHFPRSNWALIYWDDDGMILIKRNGANQSLLTHEYTAIFPEGVQNGITYQEMLARSRRLDKPRAVIELQRKLHEEPDCRRAQKLLLAIQAVE
jgi:hypothetical protein